MTGTEPSPAELRFRGGVFGALAPFVVFLAGVVWLGLSGAPDERGFWPMLLAALALGLALARDRHAYSDILIQGMSQPIVMLMIMAWLLAGVFGALLSASGLVDALVWLASAAGVSGVGFIVASFLVCCGVSTATGTSLGTLILCTPLLYPAGTTLGAHPPLLVGALLGGATFGDNISPVSDTTIASAATQGADLGGVVRSRLRYALPAAALALVAYIAFGALGASSSPLVAGPTQAAEQWPDGLPMLLAPILVFTLLLRRKHLIEGLLAGIATAIVLGLGLGLLTPGDLLYIDSERFGARGLIVEGMEKALGVSIFTILLMGLVATLEASGFLGRLLAWVETRTSTPRGAELWTFAAVSAATLSTTHPTVAILAVGPLARRSGERFGLDPYRRSNLLDVTVCTYPFLLPYCIPPILVASLTAGTAAPRISPWAAGLYNFHSWALLVVIVAAIFTGYGRSAAASSSD